MQDFTRTVDLLTVNYNTPDLLFRLYESVRRCMGSAYTLTVVDGSEERCMDYTNSIGLDDELYVMHHFPFNIHHGRGMDFGIRYSNKPFVLILDSDSELLQDGILDAMFRLIEADTYAVAEVIMTDRGGKSYGDGTKSVRYGHPRCMLIRKDKYLSHACFENRGAPCIQAMKRIGGMVVDFPQIHKYFKGGGRGTVDRFGHNHKDYLNDYKYTG